MEKWIEVDPGAPFPPNVPPWAERHELVKRPGLSEGGKKAVQGAGLALLAGGLATTLLVSSGSGIADVYASFVAILGLVILFVGLIGVPPSEKFVPSPGGRYVAVEVAPQPVDRAEAERSHTFERRAVLGIGGLGGAVVLGVLLLEYLQGTLTLEVVRTRLLPMLVPSLPFMVLGVVRAVQRRLKSESEASERFLRAADPRVPLDATSAPGPAGEQAPGSEREPA